jgi:hypothetical protein
MPNRTPAAAIARGTFTNQTALDTVRLQQGSGLDDLDGLGDPADPHHEVHAHRSCSPLTGTPSRMTLVEARHLGFHPVE